MPEIGATLREARMRARIDIGEVELRTKIRAKYLRAMENEEWNMLPGSVYIKSFLRTYCDFLGLDSRMLIDEYRRLYERPSEHDPTSIATLRRERERDLSRGPRGPLLPPWAVVGIALVVIVVILFVVGNLTGSQNPSPRTHGNATTGHTTPAHSPTTATTPGRAAAAPKKVTLTIKATAQVYICMTNQNGKPLINAVTYNPGQPIPTETASQLRLTLGNSSVKLHASFGPIPVAPSAKPTNLLIGPTSVKTLPATGAPTCG